MDVDWKNTCRTCLSSNDLIDIFPTSSSHKIHGKANKTNVHSTVAIAIEECYNIAITPDDGYSTKICENCTKLVTMFRCCRQHAATSDNLHRNNALLLQIGHKEKPKVELFNSPESTSDTTGSNQCSTGHISSMSDEPLSTVIDRTRVIMKKNKKKPLEEVREIGTTIDPKNILRRDGRRKKKPFRAKYSPTLAAKGSPLHRKPCKVLNKKVFINKRIKRKGKLERGDEEIQTDAVLMTMDDSEPMADTPTPDSDSSRNTHETLIEEFGTFRRTSSGRKLKPTERLDS